MNEERLGGKLRLICLSYAGGGPSAFRGWDQRLSRHIAICPLGLPGRERRYGERLLTSMKQAKDDLMRHIAVPRDSPFAIFGHSIGAVLAYELAHELEKRLGRLPLRLFVSGCPAPHLRKPKNLHLLPSDLLMAELRKLGGTPPCLLEDPEFMEFFLPVIRADMKLLEKYRASPSRTLSCPITALTGESDVDVPVADVEQWCSYTSAEFRLRVLPGDHFFLHSSQAELLTALEAELFSVA